MKTERKNPHIAEKLKTAVKTLIQRLFLTFRLFNENGLSNHAAAGAYGFLLSAAPILFLICFFLFFVFKSSSAAVASMVKGIPALAAVFDEQWLSGDFMALALPGMTGAISGIISAISIFWAGGIFASSLQRGLKIIFPGSRKPNLVKEKLLIMAAEALVIIFILVMILSSQAALYIYEAFNLFPKTSVFYFLVSITRYRIFPAIILGLVSFLAYLLLPVNPPRRLSALQGAVLCVFTYECVAIVLGILLNHPRYDFFYGTLGGLVIQLVNAYIFFLLFFFGAQFTFVIDSFEALLFVELRHTRVRAAEKGKAAHGNVPHRNALSFNSVKRLFFSVEGNLKKYSRSYKKGETIFSFGDKVAEIFYLLEGEVSVLLQQTRAGDPGMAGRGSPQPQETGTVLAVLGPDSFFGEMSYLLSENRTATVKAKSDVSVLALPGSVFEDILKYDATIDRTIIEYMSRRIENNNKQISDLIAKAEN